MLPVRQGCFPACIPEQPLRILTSFSAGFPEPGTEALQTQPAPPAFQASSTTPHSGAPGRCRARHTARAALTPEEIDEATLDALATQLEGAVLRFRARALRHTQAGAVLRRGAPAKFDFLAETAALLRTNAITLSPRDIAGLVDFVDKFPLADSVTGLFDKPVGETVKTLPLVGTTVQKVPLVGGLFGGGLFGGSGSKAKADGGASARRGLPLVDGLFGDLPLVGGVLGKSRKAKAGGTTTVTVTASSARSMSTLAAGTADGGVAPELIVSEKAAEPAVMPTSVATPSAVPLATRELVAPREEPGMLANALKWVGQFLPAERQKQERREESEDAVKALVDEALGDFVGSLQREDFQERGEGGEVETKSLLDEVLDGFASGLRRSMDEYDGEVETKALLDEVLGSVASGLRA